MRPPVKQLTVYSAGFGHGEPFPTADHVADLRRRFHDPADQGMIMMTGLDGEVQDRVRACLGYGTYLDALWALAVAVEQTDPSGPVVLVTACGGGRHRGVVVAEDLGQRAADEGWTADVRHLHIGHPILRPTTQD